MSEKEELLEHKKWLDKVEKEFNQSGFTTIREGKMFLLSAHWKEPDLFVLRDTQLILVLEVMVEPNYDKLLDEKLRPIKHCYNPRYLRVFEPVEFMNREYGRRLRSHYAKKMAAKGYPPPTSYRQVEDFHEEQWRKKEHIEVSFWNEKDYQAHIRELVSKFTT